MDLITYQEQTLRTLPKLGSPINDSLHMTVGIMTEIAEIVDIMVSDYDPNKIKDELGDVMWYLSNYSNLLGVAISDFKDKIVGFGPINVQSNIDGLLLSASKLLDMDKKTFAYGKVYTKADKVNAMMSVFYYVTKLAEEHQVDLSEAMDLNIKKLRVRFPDKFVSDQAINRDVEKENKVFTEKEGFSY
jgi:NTP pyrophosphatase (non-canonical NTP hydrolase)